MFAATVNRCTGGNTVNFNNTYINSPGYPNGVSTAGTCTNTGASGRFVKNNKFYTFHCLILTPVFIILSLEKEDFYYYFLLPIINMHL
jgi:hypothetical protein